jgi:hypothetical protein
LGVGVVRAAVAGLRVPRERGWARRRARARGRGEREGAAGRPALSFSSRFAGAAGLWGLGPVAVSSLASSRRAGGDETSATRAPGRERAGWACVPRHGTRRPRPPPPSAPASHASSCHSVAGGWPDPAPGPRSRVRATSTWRGTVHHAYPPRDVFACGFVLAALFVSAVSGCQRSRPRRGRSEKPSAAMFLCVPSGSEEPS